MTTQEILGFCFNIVVAGIETTTNLIANGIALLAAHPDSARRGWESLPLRIAA